MKRPVWFTDWRKLYRDECLELGYMLSGYRPGTSCIHGHQIHITKRLYKQIRRVERLRDRLQVESEVKDATWCREMLRAIFDSDI